MNLLNLAESKKEGTALALEETRWAPYALARFCRHAVLSKERVPAVETTCTRQTELRYPRLISTTPLPIVDVIWKITEDRSGRETARSSGESCDPRNTS